MNIVEMRYCRGTKDMIFEINPDINIKYHQTIHGNGYNWEGDTLIIMKNDRVQFKVPNTILK